jgi:hypothetical protein
MCNQRRLELRHQPRLERCAGADLVGGAVNGSRCAFGQASPGEGLELVGSRRRSGGSSSSPK